MDPTNPKILYSGNAGSIFKSTDGGKSWLPADKGLGRGYRSTYALALNRPSPKTLVAATDSGVWKTKDAAATWKRVGLNKKVILSLAIDKTNPDIVFAGTALNGVFKTVNGGASWISESKGLPNGASIQALMIDPSVPNVMYAGTSSAGVYKSPDGGKSWQAAHAGITTVSVSSLLIIKGPSGGLFAGTSLGVFSSVDSGLKWEKLGRGLPGDSIIYALAYERANKRIYAGGNNGVFWISWP
jgi:photosystem II stability/assembly factor-like uncharacterized protein